MTLELAGDLSLAVLLLLTLVWCVLLLRKLRRINLDRRDIADLIAGIDAATRRAEAAMGGIREAAREAQAAIGKERDQLDARAADLARLAEGAGQMVRRLEQALHGGARTMAEVQLGRDPNRAGGRPLGATQAARATAGASARPASATSGERPAGRLDGALLRALDGLR